MRDVYNRRKKLSDWIEKVNQDLDRSDRTDVLKFVEYMKYNANAILWIVRSLKYECEESPLISRGASVPYGKPTTKELREITLDQFRITYQ